MIANIIKLFLVNIITLATFYNLYDIYNLILPF